MPLSPPSSSWLWKVHSRCFQSIEDQASYLLHKLHHCTMVWTSPLRSWNYPCTSRHLVGRVFRLSLPAWPAKLYWGHSHWPAPSCQNQLTGQDRHEAGSSPYPCRTESIPSVFSQARRTNGPKNAFSRVLRLISTTQEYGHLQTISGFRTWIRQTQALNLSFTTLIPLSLDLTEYH